MDKQLQIKDALDFVKHRTEKINELKNIDIINFLSNLLDISKNKIEIKKLDNIYIIYIYDNLILIDVLVKLYNALNDKSMYLMCSNNIFKLYIDAEKLKKAIH